MSAEELFHRRVVTALEGAPAGKLKVSELRLQTRIRRGITDIVSEMKQKGLVVFSGYASMETEVALAGR